LQQNLQETLKQSKTVIFHFNDTDTEALGAMYRVMNGTAAGSHENTQKFVSNLDRFSWKIYF